MVETILQNITDLIGLPREVLLASPLALAVGFHALSSQKAGPKVDERGRSVDFKAMLQAHAVEQSQGNVAVTALLVGAILGAALYCGLNPDTVDALLAHLPGL